MEINTTILLAVIAMVLAGAFISTILILEHRRKNAKEPKKKGNGKNRLYFLYLLYSSVPGISKLFARLKKQVATIYPADNLSINKKATNIMTSAMIIALGGTVFSWIVTGNDIFYGFMGTYFSIVLSIGKAKSIIAKLNRELYEEMVESVNRVNDLYTSNNRDVVKALQDAVYEIPYTCSLHFQKIHDILVSKNMKYEMNKYRGTAPNPYLELFLAACSSVRSFGDKADKRDANKTIFMKNLDYITEDIENELLAMDENADRFRHKTLFCTASLFTVKPLEIGAIHFLPKLAKYYSGLTGVLSLTIVFIVSVICYLNITSLRDGDMAEDKYNSLWAKLEKNAFIGNIAENIYTKKYVKYRKYNEWLAALGDYTGVKPFIVKRIAYAVIGFIATISVFAVGTQISKYTSIRDFSAAFESAVAPNDEFRLYMEDVAKEQATMYYNANYDKDELMVVIKENTEIKNDVYADEVAEVVLESINKYKNTYFRFWYVLIAIAVSALCYWYPLYKLQSKAKFIALRQDEEVSRFQTIILLLMHQDSMRVDIILEWLERFSYCFREQVADCSITYSYNKKKAIRNMRNHTVFKPFHSICDSLLNVDDVGIAAAFSRIESDRLYSKDKRKAQKLRTVNRRANIADMQALIPLYTAVGMMLLVPIGRFAYDAMMVITQYSV